MVKILISHITGNENTRNIVYGLQKAQLLHSFIVSIAVYKNSFCYYLSYFKPFAFFRKRELPTTLKRYTVTYPFKEIGRQLSLKFKFKKLISIENAIFSSYSEARYIDNKTSRYLEKFSEDIDIVYCYEDIALNTFKKAKQLHKFRVYELPVAYWRFLHALLATERDNNPDWYITINNLKDSEKKLSDKDKEIEMADVIFVASSYTKKSLSLFPGNLPPVYVIPYGFPPVNNSRTYSLLTRDKIKLLYVGNLSQGKGLSYMFDAVEGLDDFYELTVVGSGDLSQCDALKRAIDKHHYSPPMAHDKILKLMSESDIFIMPSLSDGFGLVITESMSQGTPVITTDRTCGPDIITDGKDGWIVNAANSVEIKKLLVELKENKEEIIRVGKNARETAKKRPWNIYQSDVVNAINNAYNTWEKVIGKHKVE